MPTSSVCFSYSRFSSDPQADGDSIRRQTALRDAYLKRHPELKLDAGEMIDAGVSGFRGRHRKNAGSALTRFVALVDSGRVPRGATLLVENIDRLGREHPEDGIPFLLSLMGKGIRIVTLAPEMVYEQGMDVGRMVMLLLESFRGHGESARKSELVAQAWGEIKRRAREEKRPIGKNHHPAWVRVEGDRHVLIPERAAVVRRIFALAVSGMSARKIVAKFEAEGVPTMGRSKNWTRSFVQDILTNRAAIGEFQPRSRAGDARPADGEPIEGYFPPVVTAAEFERVRAAATSRQMSEPKKRPARYGHPFQGLLRCALDNCGMYTIRRQKRRYVVSINAYEASRGGFHWRPFPLDTLTAALLSEMRELAAADLFADPSAGRVAELTAALAAAERRLGVAFAKFEADPESTAWQSKVDEYDRERRRLVKEIAAARLEEFDPLPARWADAVAEMARNDPARLRIAIGGLIEEIRVLVVSLGRGKGRACAAQVYFSGGASRLYLIRWTPGVTLRRSRRPESWRVVSVPLEAGGGDLQRAVARATGAKASGPFLDLRDRADVAALESILSRGDVSEWESLS